MNNGKPPRFPGQRIELPPHVNIKLPGQGYWPGQIPPGEPLPTVHNPIKRHVTGGTKLKVIERDKWTCKICGFKTDRRAFLHVDHVISLTRGGTNDIGNLQTLCVDCNLRKGNRDNFKPDLRLPKIVPVPIVKQPARKPPAPRKLIPKRLWVNLGFGYGFMLATAIMSIYYIIIFRH